MLIQSWYFLSWTLKLKSRTFKISNGRVDRLNEINEIYWKNGFHFTKLVKYNQLYICIHFNEQILIPGKLEWIIYKHDLFKEIIMSQWELIRNEYEWKRVNADPDS